VAFAFPESLFVFQPCWYFIAESLHSVQMHQPQVHVICAEIHHQPVADNVQSSQTAVDISVISSVNQQLSEMTHED